MTYLWSKEYWETATPESLAENFADKDLHIKKEIGKITPLMNASMYSQNPQVIQALLDRGADIHARNVWGVTPLMFAAAWNKNPEIIKILINNEADIRAKSHDGITAWDYLQRNDALKDSEVSELLKDSSPDAYTQKLVREKEQLS